MKTKSLLCIFFLLPFFVCAQTSWKGTTSTVWSTASNWTAGVPNSSTDAIIGDASFTGSFQPSLTSGSPTCKTLTLGADTKASKNQYNGVDINWSTASEKSNDYFTIERTSDGDVFEKVADMDGAGNSIETLNYKLTDASPLPGTSYYRLKQTDFDGQYSFSKLIAVDFSNALPVIVYPNPVYLEENSSLKITGLTTNTEAVVKISTMQGEVILTKQVANQTGTDIYLTDPYKFTAGIYFVEIITGSGVYKQKIIVY